MHRYIPVIALLLALGASTTPAQAHVPAVGDRAWFTMLCREEAHDVLIELAREKGLSFVENRLRRFVNGYQCFPQALPVPGHIVAVADPVQHQRDLTCPRIAHHSGVKPMAPAEASDSS
ncbi:hypothetical protein LCGC14_2147510 [marine sediment metagenome]|uniref:Uncharacterized protein n=1 Tax=marine sediment metagenome TaxID=412755 RepID=A0A0F9DWF8_9ZZZZ